MNNEKEYILGTHDEEVVRLGLQHRVWRPRALDAWLRAGITVGQTVLDVGCGPGYAARDIAGIVGPLGHVHAFDLSSRFLAVLEAACREHRLTNITPYEVDLNESDLPPLAADAAWARWVFAFVKNPRALLGKVHRSLKPGGILVLHEYLDYSTWRLVPRSADFEEFVRVVMESWRAGGGEPDIGPDLALWLDAAGFKLTSLRPIIDIVPPSSFIWQWPKAFVRVNLQRLVDLGHLGRVRAAEIGKTFDEREQAPGTLMVTPAVLEILAVRS